MPKHEQPIQTFFDTTSAARPPRPRWQDMGHGPMKGQRQAKHSRPPRVPGKGSGR